MSLSVSFLLMMIIKTITHRFDNDEFHSFEIVFGMFVLSAKMKKHLLFKVFILLFLIRHTHTHVQIVPDFVGQIFFFESVIKGSKLCSTTTATTTFEFD